MKDLSVNYLGLKLKNPIIISSSGLTCSAERITSLAEAGAGAVVVKSLFEEQIDIETAAQNYFAFYPEANDYIAEYTRYHSIEKHLNIIKEAKKSCSIPIIASISCVSPGEWTTFAKRFEESGADALELNMFILPVDKDLNQADIEKKYLETVSKVCDNISIPVSVKIGQNFTNIPELIRELSFRGAKGVVMFNRFYEPDIDIEKMTVTAGNIFSMPSDFRNVLRWLSIASSAVKNIDYAASTGIHDGEAAVKALLAGATGVQLCSAVYQKGETVIGDILGFMESWMNRHHFQSAADFIGKMNYDRIQNPLVYERTQFMKYFASKE